MGNRKNASEIHIQSKSNPRAQTRVSLPTGYRTRPKNKMTATTATPPSMSRRR